VPEAVEGGLCLLEELEVMLCMLFCMLEAVEDRLCSMEVMRCMRLRMLDAEEGGLGFRVSKFPVAVFSLQFATALQNRWVPSRWNKAERKGKGLLVTRAIIAANVDVERKAVNWQNPFAQLRKTLEAAQFFPPTFARYPH